MQLALFVAFQPKNVEIKLQHGNNGLFGWRWWRDVDGGDAESPAVAVSKRTVKRVVVGGKAGGVGKNALAVEGGAVEREAL